jgi:carboxyl-terminal processing protease
MSFRGIAIAVLCALIALAAGLWLGGHPGSLPGPARDVFVDEDRAVRAELINEIEDNFYKHVDEEKLDEASLKVDEASLKALVRSLGDRFSNYLTPREARQFRELSAGRFDGVGMSVEQDRRGLQVLNVFERSPAREAGIRKGDLIVAVNGRSIAGVSSQVATARIKGPAGTTVRLEVLSPDTDRRRTLRVTRRRIEVPVADGRLVERDGTKLGVVELVGFWEGAHGLLRREIEPLLRDGAKGLVFDLRGNSGGLLTEAVLVSSIFIEEGKVVSVRGLHRPERTEIAQGDALVPKLPVVVLVDNGSASASEIVAGALRDRGRATVVGTNTFGKGLVQEVERLSHGGELHLTVANYYLPGGRTIGTDGLKPQVRARDDQKTRRDEALPKALDTLLEKTR